MINAYSSSRTNTTKNQEAKKVNRVAEQFESLSINNLNWLFNTNTKKKKEGSSSGIVLIIR